MSQEYIKAQMRYRELAKAAAGGDKQAHVDKAKAMNEIREIERSSARAGTVLSSVVKADGKVTVQTQDCDSKRSLQEEYCRKFNDDAPVKIGGKEQTMRQYHRNRLLKRS